MSFLYVRLLITFYCFIKPTLSLSNYTITGVNYTTQTTILNKNKYINDVQRHYHTWDMVHAIGKTYNAKMWTLHFNPTQDISWKRFWHHIVKEHKDIGYFGTKTVCGLQYIERPRVPNGITMNLFVNVDIKFLNLLISNSSNGYGSRDNLHSTVWMIKMPDMANKEMMIDLLNETIADYDSNVFCYTFIEDNVAEIYDVYKISRGSSTIIKKWGRWSIMFGLQLLDPEIWSRRVSLEGHHINVASAYNPPAVTYIEDNCANQKCFKGMFADVWHAMAEEMNLTYSIKKSNQWGSFINGSWNGMVGMIQRGIADIAVADLTVTKERSSVVDFLPSIMETNEELFISCLLYTSDAADE